MKTRVFFGMLLAVAALSGAAAQSVSERIRRAQSNDTVRQAQSRLCESGYYQKKYDQNAPLAEKGDPAAQNAMGDYHRYGNCNPPDLAKAHEWYLKAANQNYAPAQDALGFLHATGQGVPRDQKQAFAWYLRAAETGDADSQLEVGNRYETGNGVAKDAALAFSWFGKAAQQGHPGAFDSLAAPFCLGYYYNREQSHDRFACYAYKLLAVNHADPERKKFRYRPLLKPEVELRNLGYARDDTPPDQRRKAEALAGAWKPGKPLPTTAEEWIKSYRAVEAVIRNR